MMLAARDRVKSLDRGKEVTGSIVSYYDTHIL